MKKTLAVLAALSTLTVPLTAQAQQYVDITDTVGSISLGAADEHVTDPVTGESARITLGAVAACTQPAEPGAPRHATIALFSDKVAPGTGVVTMTSDFDIRNMLIPSHTTLQFAWENHTTGESASNTVAATSNGSYHLETGPLYVGSGHVTYTATLTKTLGPALPSAPSSVDAPSAGVALSGDVILSDC